MSEAVNDGQVLRDYVGWHAAYDEPGSRLHLRLLVVQDLISQALDELPQGAVRMISMCAGQGRDILSVAQRHRRGPDINGRLVELEPANAACARGVIDGANLHGIEVAVGDAGVTDSYEGATPAELILACGVFGNIPDDDIEKTIGLLPTMAAPGAWAIWTRYPEGEAFRSIPGWFESAGFTIKSIVTCEREAFSVGAAQFQGSPAPLVPGTRLFSFTR